MSFRKIARRTWWRPDIFAALLLLGTTAARALDYREDFANPGKPAAPPGHAWSYLAELSPAKSWYKIVPGDGFAYLSVERSLLKPRRHHGTFWPFQTITFGPVGPGHRFAMRARDTAIPGVASMIFIHREKETLDEIDIEIVADDTHGPGTGHPTGSEGGWTDVRLNTYAAADTAKFVPSRKIHTAITDADGRRVSHQDGKFHTYAFEWRTNSVRFLIDGVEQAVVEDVVPQGEADLIVGLRQMPWASRPNWEDYRTMLIDWIAIEPLDNESPEEAPPSRQKHTGES